MHQPLRGIESNYKSMDLGDQSHPSLLCKSDHPLATAKWPTLSTNLPQIPVFLFQNFHFQDIGVEITAPPGSSPPRGVTDLLLAAQHGRGETYGDTAGLLLSRSNNTSLPQKDTVINYPYKALKDARVEVEMSVHTKLISLKGR